MEMPAGLPDLPPMIYLIALPMQIIRAKPENATALTAIAFAAKGHWGYPEQWM